MARPQTKGFRSMTISTNEFSEDKVRVLLGTFGLDGYGIYRYIEEAAYRTGEYYLRWDENSLAQAAYETYVDGERIKAIVEYCVKMKILSKVTADGDTYLTSETIQRNCQKMAIRAKKVCERHDSIWLLPEEETDERAFNPDILNELNKRTPEESGETERG